MDKATKEARATSVKRASAVANYKMGSENEPGAEARLLAHDVLALASLVERYGEIVEAARPMVEASHNAMVVMCKQSVKIDRKGTDDETVRVFQQVEAAHAALTSALAALTPEGEGS